MPHDLGRGSLIAHKRITMSKVFIIAGTGKIATAMRTA